MNGRKRAKTYCHVIACCMEDPAEGLWRLGNCCQQPHGRTGLNFEKEIAPHVDGDNVKYLGVVTNRERDELLQQAYMVLHLNTIPERFGLVMVEAMAAGVPVVAMDLGSCREVIANGQTGFLVNDVDQAVKAIKKIPEISRRACRQRAEKHFSSDVMVKNYEKVYRRIFQLEKRKMREGI